MKGQACLCGWRYSLPVLLSCLCGWQYSLPVLLSCLCGWQYSLPVLLSCLCGWQYSLPVLLLPMWLAVFSPSLVVAYVAGSILFQSSGYRPSCLYLRRLQSLWNAVYWWHLTRKPRLGAERLATPNTKHVLRLPTDRIVRGSLVALVKGGTYYPEGSLFSDCELDYLHELIETAANQSAWGAKVASPTWQQ